MNDKVLKIKKSTLVDIANEVRAKTGSTDLIKIADLDDAIKNISGSGSGGGIENATAVCSNDYHLTTNTLNNVEIRKVSCMKPHTLEFNVSAAENEVNRTNNNGFTTTMFIYDDYTPTLSYEKVEGLSIADDRGKFYFMSEINNAEIVIDYTTNDGNPDQIVVNLPFYRVEYDNYGWVKNQALFVGEMGSSDCNSFCGVNNNFMRDFGNGPDYDGNIDSCYNGALVYWVGQSPSYTEFELGSQNEFCQITSGELSENSVYVCSNLIDWTYNVLLPVLTYHSSDESLNETVFIDEEHRDLYLFDVINDPSHITNVKLKLTAPGTEEAFAINVVCEAPMPM